MSADASNREGRVGVADRPPSPSPSLSPASQLPRFIMDFSMNKIAKYLRLLGYDTVCARGIAQDDLIALAAAEGRALVTCSSGMLEQVAAHNRRVGRLSTAPPPPRRVVAYDSDGESVYSSSSEVVEAVVRVVRVQQWRSSEFRATMMGLIQEAGVTYDPRLVFSRCVACNDRLVTVEKQTVQSRVEPKIYAMYAEFAECPSCRKVFWGFDGDRVTNYKSLRTLGMLRSLCLAAGAPVNEAATRLSTLKSFWSFPRRVKATVFSYLTDEDLAVVAEVFTVLADLAVEVQSCRRRGVPVPTFKEIKGCRK